MPRTAASGLTIEQLERILAARRSQIRKLSKRRDRLQRQLDAFDRQIAQLGGSDGSGGRGAGQRARNEQSLVAVIAEVLRFGKPMNVGDVTEQVQKRGYRSSSANFRGIVNQTLIKEKQFQQTSRGMYQLKK